MNSTLIKVISPIAVIGAGIGIYALLFAVKPEPEQKEEPPRALSVFVQPVMRSDVPLKVTTQGEVRAKTQVDIIAQVAGRIVEVSPEFIEGGRVEPGVPLVRIEPVDYELEVKRAQAAVAEAEVRVQQALADADVARKQLRGSANPSPLALKKPQVAQAQAMLTAGEAALSRARLDLERTQMSLPFPGRVISTMVDVGQYVRPGEMIGTAFSQEVVEIRVPLTDSQLASLDLPIGYVAAEGVKPLAVEITAQVAGREHSWMGALSRLDASINPETRMVFGTAEVRNPYGQGVSEYGMPLAVGLFVSAEISGRELQDAYIIPRHALRAGNQVYVVNDEGKLEIRTVEVTHSSAEDAVINTGLEAGDNVVVSSIRNPIEGMALEALPYGLDNSAVAKEGHRPVRRSDHIEMAGG